MRGPFENPIAFRRLGGRRALREVLPYACLALVAAAATEAIEAYGPLARSRLSSFPFFAVWIPLALDTLLVGLVAPTAFAYALAEERRRGTIETLRLAGARGRSLVAGALAVAWTGPLTFALLTSPLLVHGALRGELGLARHVECLVSLSSFSVAATALAGVVAWSAPRPALATGLAAGSAALALAASASYGADGFEPAGLLGPWIALAPAFRDDLLRHGIATPGLRDALFLPVSGLGLVPATLVQPFVLVPLASLLFVSLARQLERERGAWLGGPEAFALAALAALVLASTFPERVGWRQDHVSFALRTLVLAGLLGVLAHDVSVEPDDVLRGLLRPAGPRRREACRLLLFPLAAAPVLGAFSFAIGVGAGRPGALACAVLLALSAGSFAATLFQSLRLLGVGLPGLAGSAALLLAWVAVPILCMNAAAWLGLEAVLEGPALACAVPFVLGLAAAAADGRGPPGTRLDPVPLALLSAAVHAVLAAGLGAVVRAQVERLREKAAGLVSLPADAFSPPGAAPRRCDAGHAFSRAWARCPHCAGAGSSRVEALEPWRRPGGHISSV